MTDRADSSRGAVVRASARHGLDATLNRAVLTLLAASSPETVEAKVAEMAGLGADVGQRTR